MVCLWLAIVNIHTVLPLIFYLLLTQTYQFSPVCVVMLCNCNGLISYQLITLALL